MEAGNLWRIHGLRHWKKGKTVEVKINPIYANNTARPTSINVEYKIGNGKWISETFDN